MGNWQLRLMGHRASVDRHIYTYMYSMCVYMSVYNICMYVYISSSATVHIYTYICVYNSEKSVWGGKSYKLSSHALLILK